MHNGVSTFESSHLRPLLDNLFFMSTLELPIYVRNKVDHETRIPNTMKFNEIQLQIGTSLESLIQIYSDKMFKTIIYRTIIISFLLGLIIWTNIGIITLVAIIIYYIYLKKRKI